MEESMQNLDNHVRHGKLAIFVIVAFLVVLSAIVIVTTSYLTKSNSCFASNPQAAEQSNLNTSLQPGQSMSLNCSGSKIVSTHSNSDKTLLVQCVANELAPTPSPFGLEFEAEDGNLSAPFQSAEGFISQSSQNNSSIAGGGRALYQVNIPQEGQYIVQALVCAKSIDENSVFLKFDSQPSSREYWIITPTGNGCNWQTANWRLEGGPESPALNPVTFNLTQGTHILQIYGREPNTRIDKFKITPASTTAAPTSIVSTIFPTNIPSNTSPTLVPSIVATLFPTSSFGTPTPLPPGTNNLLPPPMVVETSDPIGANEWCGRYPNCKNNCVAISSQGWVDDDLNADAHEQTHQHSEHCAPVWRGTGRFYVPSNIDYPVRMIAYNPFDNGQPENLCSSSTWVRNQWQGNTFSQKNFCMQNTQTAEDQRKEFRHTVVLKMDVSKGGGGVNELRTSPNAIHPLVGRHFTSSNTQIDTGISPDGIYGYRADSLPSKLYRGSNPACNNPTNKATNIMTRYWVDTYKRTAFLNAGCLIPPDSSRALLKGTVALGFEASGATGSCTTALYLSPAFHRHGRAAKNLSNPIFENHSCGTFTYNFDSTTKPDGLYSLVFMQIEKQGSRQITSVTKLETTIDN